ncbi:MAG: hypothetical protein M3Y08_20450 [Fibrobacterota bacterium]|nr:hypothetical protein [Fibrobacterota bacterium]
MQHGKLGYIIAGIVAFFALSVSAQTWTDITSSVIAAQNMSPGFPGGCSGVAVNRLTGDVYVQIIGYGIWKSPDQGTTWTRIDQNTVGGRCETGVAMTADQDNPVRLASFSLDGNCGHTSDGVTWHKWTDMGRNWDFGSVDWGAANPLVMLAAKHEDGGKVYKTVDGGVTWTLLPIAVNAQSNNNSSMIGVMDANTFIYCANGGIQRSTDQGASWVQVSTTVARTKIPVLFKGKHYLGAATGLWVSSDKGATWTKQGASIEICQGPYFGADENTMVIANTQGIYKSTNAGTAWTNVAGLPTPFSGNTFDPLWFAGFSWDPVRNTIYGTRMACPAFKFVMQGTSITNPFISASQLKNVGAATPIIRMSDNRILIDAEENKVYNLEGRRQSILK